MQFSVIASLPTPGPAAWIVLSAAPLWPEDLSSRQCTLSKSVEWLALVFSVQTPMRTCTSTPCLWQCCWSALPSAILERHGPRLFADQDTHPWIAPSPGKCVQSFSSLLGMSFVAIDILATAQPNRHQCGHAHTPRIFCWTLDFRILSWLGPDLDSDKLGLTTGQDTGWTSRSARWDAALSTDE